MNIYDKFLQLLDWFDIIMKSPGTPHVPTTHAKHDENTWLFRGKKYDVE